MERYIDATTLSKTVFESMKENPHTDSIVRRTHHHEHERFLRMIDNVPTADVVEVKHGYWIGFSNTGQYDDWKCSHCGKFEEVRNRNNCGDYCKWCGAKMDGEKNG